MLNLLFDFFLLIAQNATQNHFINWSQLMVIVRAFLVVSANIRLPFFASTCPCLLKRQGRIGALSVRFYHKYRLKIVVKIDFQNELCSFRFDFRCTLHLKSNERSIIVDWLTRDTMSMTWIQKYDDSIIVFVLTTVVEKFVVKIELCACMKDFDSYASSAVKR